VDPVDPDRLVLVASVGPETLAALLMLAIGVAGAAVGAIMARRGRVEALSLVGLFGLLILGALFALAHLPARLSIDRNGIDVALWGFRQHRGWHDIAAVDVRRDGFGTWLWFAERPGQSRVPAIWPPRAGFPDRLAAGRNPSDRHADRRVAACRIVTRAAGKSAMKARYWAASEARSSAAVSASSTVLSASGRGIDTML
jgi:hypothetical protein